MPPAWPDDTPLRNNCIEVASGLTTVWLTQVTSGDLWSSADFCDETWGAKRYKMTSSVKFRKEKSAGGAPQYFQGARRRRAGISLRNPPAAPRRSEPQRAAARRGRPDDGAQDPVQGRRAASTLSSPGRHPVLVRAKRSHKTLSSSRKHFANLHNGLGILITRTST